MRLINKILVVLASFFMFACVASAVSNPYGKYQDLYGVKTVRCTWYAWNQAYNNAGVALPGWGNAQEWYNSAAMSGYSVGREAKSNSIAVWSSSDSYGHVAYVVSVDSDGVYMTVNEGGIPTTENEGIVIGARKSTSAANLIGFIYLNDAPSSSSSSSSSSASSSNNISSVSKSSNNNLSSLSIDIADFVFDNEILEYDLDVSYDVQIITIKATAEDNNATVTGTGQKALRLGNNTYSIIVTAENGDKKKYIININRHDLETNGEIKSTTTVTKVEDDNALIYILGICLLIILIISVIVVIFKRKKKCIKLIIFDLVGVLVTEKDLLMDENEEKIEKLFGPNKSDEEFITNAQKYIKDKNKIIKITKNLINNLYEVKYPDIFKDIKSNNSDVTLLIATNHVSFVKNFIKKNIDGYDDIIVSADIGYIKPNKEFYEYILNKYNVKGNEALFIDDNKENIKMAKKLGMYTLKVNAKTNLIKKVKRIK